MGRRMPLARYFTMPSSLSLGLLSNAKLGLGLLKGRNLPFGHCERSGGYRKRALRCRVAHLPAPKTLDLCQWGVRRHAKRYLKRANSGDRIREAKAIDRRFPSTPDQSGKKVDTSRREHERRRPNSACCDGRADIVECDVREACRPIRG